MVLSVRMLKVRLACDESIGNQSLAVPQLFALGLMRT
jgi:hypothetical protein